MGKQSDDPHEFDQDTPEVRWDDVDQAASEDETVLEGDELTELELLGPGDQWWEEYAAELELDDEPDPEPGDFWDPERDETCG